MENLVSNLANNQVIIEDRTTGKKEFHSYSTKIAEVKENKTLLSCKNWNYSRTTIKYLCKFLGYKNKNEVLAGLQSGDLFLTNKF